MAERTVLDERVEHIQNDVTEMKKDIRRLDEKIDAVRADVANLRSEVKESIGEVKTQIASILGTTKASEIALIKWMTGIVLSAIGVASAIAFGIAKLVS